MPKRSIEETFQAIKPKGSKGIPAPSTASVGISSNDNDLAGSLSQAGQQIAQLQSAYQQQAALITANTQAVQGNTSAQGSHSGTSTAGSIASSLLGGSLGLLSPLISGIASLFGGSSAPAPLPVYTPPASVSINGALSAPVAAPYTPPQAATSGVQAPSSTTPASGTQSTGSGQQAAAQQITVNVNAMDSQSFMDRSSDIADAVRQAMLNLHPINGVVASL